MKNILMFSLVLMIISGCTSVSVQPVESGYNITAVCIEKNTRVIVQDFLPVLREGFGRHGIKTRIVGTPTPDNCEYLLTYTALKHWDMASYMHHAELRLESKGYYLGSAVYHLKAEGGLTLTKYQSTKTKIDPIIDKLLCNVNK